MSIPSEEQKSRGASIMNDMLGLLGLDASVKDTPDTDASVIALKTPEPGRLIGRKGQYLQNLELLLNRILRKQLGPGPWLELEVDGYEKKPRSRRGKGPNVDRERLEKMALDAAKEVQRWGEVRTLGPLNAAERRIIHMTLRELAGVETESSEPDNRGRKKISVRPA